MPDPTRPPSAPPATGWSLPVERDRLVPAPFLPHAYAVLLALRGPSSPSNEIIERVLEELVSDWLRFTRGQYIVIHVGSPDSIYDRLKALLDPVDSMLVLEANLHNRQGWVPKMTIDWLARNNF